MQLHYYYILFLSWILLGSCRKVNNIPLRQTSSNDVNEKENLLLCPSGFDNRRYDIGFGLYTRKKSMDRRNLKLGNFKPNIDTFGRNDIDIKFYKVIPSLIESSVRSSFLNNNGRSINPFYEKVNFPVYQSINNIPAFFFKSNIFENNPNQYGTYKENNFRHLPRVSKESRVEVETFKSIPLNFGNELDTTEIQNDAPLSENNFQNFFNNNHRIVYQLSKFGGQYNDHKNFVSDRRVPNSQVNNFKKDHPKIVVKDRIRYIEFQNDSPIQNQHIHPNQKIRNLMNTNYEPQMPMYQIQESSSNKNVEKFKSVTKEISENTYPKVQVDYQNRYHTSRISNKPESSVSNRFQEHIQENTGNHNLDHFINNLNNAFNYGKYMVYNRDMNLNNINEQQKIHNPTNQFENLQKIPSALYFRNDAENSANKFQINMDQNSINHNSMNHNQNIQNLNQTPNHPNGNINVQDKKYKTDLNQNTMYLNHIRNAQNLHMLQTIHAKNINPKINHNQMYLNQNIPNNQLTNVQITKSSEINPFTNQFSSNINHFENQNNIHINKNGPQLFDNQYNEQNNNNNFQSPNGNSNDLNQNPFIPPKISDSDFSNIQMSNLNNIKSNDMESARPLQASNSFFNHHDQQQHFIQNNMKSHDYQIPNTPINKFINNANPFLEPLNNQQSNVEIFRQPRMNLPPIENLVHIPENSNEKIVDNFQNFNNKLFSPQPENNIAFPRNIQFIPFTKEDAIDVKENQFKTIPNDGTMYSKYHEVKRNDENFKNIYQNDKPVNEINPNLSFDSNFRRNDLHLPFNLADPKVAQIQLEYFKNVINAINNNEIENKSTNLLDVKNKNHTKYNFEKYKNEKYNFEGYGRKPKLMRSVLDLFDKQKKQHRLHQNNLNKNHFQNNIPAYDSRTNNQRYLRPISGVFGKNEIFAVPASRIDGGRKRLHRISDPKLFLAKRTTDDDSGKSELELLLPLPEFDEPKRQFRRTRLDKRIGKGEVRYGPDSNIHFTNLHPRLRSRYNQNKNNQWENSGTSSLDHSVILNQELKHNAELESRNKDEENIGQDHIEASAPKKEKNKVFRLRTRFSVNDPLGYSNSHRDGALRNIQTKSQETKLDVSENDTNDFKTVPYEMISKGFGFDNFRILNNAEIKNLFDSKYSTVAPLENLDSRLLNSFLPHEDDYNPIHDVSETTKLNEQTQLNNFKDFAYNDKYNTKVDQYAVSTEEYESEYGPTKLKPYKSNTDSELVQESFRKLVLDPTYENTETYSRYTGGNKRNFIRHRLDKKKENINFNTYNKVNVYERNKNILPHLLSDPKLKLNFQPIENEKKSKNNPRYDFLQSQTNKNFQNNDYRSNLSNNPRGEYRHNLDSKNRNFLIYEVNNPLNFLRRTLLKQNRHDAHSNHNYNVKNSLFPHLLDTDQSNLKDNREDINKHVIEQINQLEALKLRESKVTQQLKQDEKDFFLKDIDYKTIQGLSLNDEGNGVSRDGKSRQRNLSRLIEAQRKSMSLNPPILPKNEKKIVVEKADGLHIFLFH